MPLKAQPYNTVKRKLVKAGFTKISQKGSHIKFYKKVNNKIITVIVPRHKEIAYGTMKSILRQAGLSQNEYDAL